MYASTYSFDSQFQVNSKQVHHSLRNTAINDAVARSLSRDRLDKYLMASGSDLDLAIGLYARNTRLSESLYTPLQALEICFRNHLDMELCREYGSGWTLDGAAPLMADGAASVANAIREVRQSESTPTPGAVVAELSFGFWVALLARRYDATLWREACHRAFRPVGKGLARQLVHGRFNSLRRFRNRIAHHEPIFHLDLEAKHAEVIEAVTWMSPETAAWARHHSRFCTAFAGP